MKRTDLNIKEILVERAQYIKYTTNYDETIDCWFDGDGDVVRQHIVGLSDELLDYDKRGKIIHYLNIETKYQYWQDIDDTGRTIKYSNTDGEWYVNEYNELGQLILHRDDIQFWIYEYDERGNKTHTINAYGYERWEEYDKDNNKIHFKDTTGREYWYRYDEHGHRVHEKNSRGHETWREFNDRGYISYSKNHSGKETWFIYGPYGEVQRHDSKGYVKWTEYDNKGNVARVTDSDGYMWTAIYDNHNNPIYTETRSCYGAEIIKTECEYDEDGECIYCHVINYADEENETDDYEICI